MEREVFVSTGGGIDVFSKRRRQSAALQGAGALCVSGDHLLCAGENGRVIWRLDRETLMPQAIYPGGPGVCDMRVSPDGDRLYALCGEADSVLMLDARSGQALVLNRAGSNPRQIASDGDTLAVAGGESGCVHLYDARTLEAMESLPMPGPVYSAALARGTVYALCLTQTLDSVLVTALPGGVRHALALGGMPGCLLRTENMLFAATQGALYTISTDGSQVLGGRHAPGRAGQLIESEGRLFAVDQLSERLFEDSAGRWRQLLAQAWAAAIG